MQAIEIIVEGNWGHFKRPETNNNPLTHDFITKTALIGMIGAVLGYERETMKPLFPQLSDDLLYGVELLQPVKKSSWGFTSRTAFKPWESGTPKYFEFLKKPSFKVLVALKEGSPSKEIFTQFTNAVKQEEAFFTPVLGWHNCPADLSWSSEGTIQYFDNEEDIKEIKAMKCFFSKNHNLKLSGSEGFRLGFENLPTFQNDDFWNLPERYEKVIYPDAGNSVNVEGAYYQYSKNNEAWWLI
jgi:CRISPR-associated protein Cas5h